MINKKRWRKIMDDIFRGEVVREVPFPTNGLPSESWKRKDWGMRVLESYASQFSPNVYVADNGNRFGRLTGIQTTIHQGGKNVTFALIEPRERYEKKVLIVRLDSSSDEATAWEVCEYFSSQHRVASPAGRASAFAQLSALKDKLPERAEIIEMEINRHPASQKPAIKPIKMEDDPIVDGPSLRIFHQVHKGKLEVGQRWRARVEGKPVVAGMTKGNAPIPIVHVNVKLLERL